MSERLTRHELKEDPLLRETAHVAEFAAKHARLLMGGAVIVIVVVLGAVFMRASARRAEDRAGEQLAQALVDVEQGNLTVAAQRLEDLVGSSAGAPSGKQGILILGDIRYALGNYVESEKLFRQAMDVYGESGLEGRVARRGLAASLENLGRHDEAAALYQGLAADAPTAEARGDLLVAAAGSLARAGKSEEARGIYDRLVEDVTMAPRVVEEARMRLAQIDQTTSH
jgi:tetratricopeptide (TPR) repeat protein